MMPITKWRAPRQLSLGTHSAPISAQSKASNMSCGLPSPAVEPSARLGRHEAPFDADRYNATPEHGRRLLLKGATLLTMDPQIGDFAEGDILIEGSRIKAIAPR